jgi:hypothetical protein
MFACLFPSYTKTSAPQHAAKEAGSPDNANGRAWTAVAPAAPRISHRSTCWQAMGNGGIKGLLYWVERKTLDSKLPRAARAQNPGAAKIALQQALSSTLKITPPKNGTEDQKKLETCLENAVWYGVDIENVVQEVYSTATAAERFSMQTACENITALALISECLADIHLAHKNLDRQVRIGFLKSNENFRAGLGLDSNVQKELWSDIDVAVKAFHPRLQGEVLDNVLTRSTRNELLFLARHHLLGCSGSLSFLQALSAKAFFLLEMQMANKAVKDIDLTAVNDVELEALGEPAGCFNFRKFKKAHKSEKQNRALIEAKAKLCESFTQRLAQVGSSKDADVKPAVFSIKKSETESFSILEQKAILRQAIAASDPEIIVRVANFSKANDTDCLLVKTAREFLASPDVAGLNNEYLIAYLGSAENEISKGTPNLFVTEANRRVDAATKAICRLIDEQFSSNPKRKFTCRSLVRAALEISAWEKIRLELLNATGAKVAPQTIEIDIGDDRSAKYSRQYKKLMFRHVSDKLRKHDNNKNGKAEIIDSLFCRPTEEPGANDLAPLDARDNEEIDEALSDFLSHTGNFDRPLGLQRLNADKENTLRIMLLDHISQTDSSRKIAEKSEEFPVCSQFLRDATQAHLSVNGALIPSTIDSSIPMHSISRGRMFLNEMRKMENITASQIFTTSRVATQSIATVFSDFLIQEKLCSLTVAEFNDLNFSKARLDVKGLLPADLQFDQSVFMKKNGNLVIRVHAVQKNIREWNGHDVNEKPVLTEERSSSFMAILNFEVDREGKILENSSIGMAFQRKVVAHP